MVNDCQQGCQDYSMRKGPSFQQTVTAKLNIHMQKDECERHLIPYYTKNNSKQIKDLNVRHKTFRGKQRGKASWHWIWQ